MFAMAGEEYLSLVGAIARRGGAAGGVECVKLFGGN